MEVKSNPKSITTMILHHACFLPSNSTLNVIVIRLREKSQSYLTHTVDVKNILKKYFSKKRNPQIKYSIRFRN
jgi:hypothetical protein